jgi:hypothetical protein
MHVCRNPTICETKKLAAAALVHRKTGLRSRHQSISQSSRTRARIYHTSSSAESKFRTHEIQKWSSWSWSSSDQNWQRIRGTGSGQTRTRRWPWAYDAETGTKTRSHCALLNTSPSSSFSRKARAARTGHGVSYALGSRQLRKCGEIRCRKKLKELPDRSGDPAAAAAMAHGHDAPDKHYSSTRRCPSERRASRGEVSCHGFPASVSWSDWSILPDVYARAVACLPTKVFVGKLSGHTTE